MVLQKGLLELSLLVKLSKDLNWPNFNLCSYHIISR